MKYSFTIDTPIEEVVDLAKRRVTIRRELIDALSTNQRSLREYASKVLDELAHKEDSVELIREFSPQIVDALNRPEALTRYCAIDMIGALGEKDPKLVEGAYDELLDCMYDEDSGTVRIYAFRVLARYGASGPARSKKVWVDLSQATRSFHGDAEFIPMLNEIIIMLQGKADQSVKDAAAELFLFDAENAKGMLKRKAETIIDFAPEVVKKMRAEKKAANLAAERKKAEAELAEDDE